MLLIVAALFTATAELYVFRCSSTGTLSPSRGPADVNFCGLCPRKWACC